jgi:hypothetical protein
MNAYHETIAMPADTLEKYEQLCRAPATDCGRDECIFDESVPIGDSMVMAIQVIACSEPEEGGCWTQGVLFDGNGAELGCTEPGDTFEGEYRVEHGGDVYEVRVTDDSRTSLLLEAAKAIESIVDLCDNDGDEDAARGADLAMRLRDLARSLD